MTPRMPTQLYLVKREQQIAETATLQQLDPFLAICKDRDERYRALLKEMSVPEELQAWAAQMKNMHDTEFCLVWHNPVPLPWVVGLLIVLYGEHEYAWPAKLGDIEIKRAEDWESGKKPRRGEVKPYMGGSDLV